MDGNRPVGTTPLNTHLNKPLVIPGSEERGRGFNRLITKVKNVFRRTPPPEGSVPRAQSLKSRTIEKTEISPAFNQRESASTRPEVPKKTIGTYLRFVERSISQDKVDTRETRAAFETAKNKLLSPGLAVAKGSLEGATEPLTGQLKGFIAKYEKQMAQQDGAITAETLSDLKRLPDQMKNELLAMGIETAQVNSGMARVAEDGARIDSLTKKSKIIQDKTEQLEAKKPNSYAELFKVQKMHIQSAQTVLAAEKQKVSELSDEGEEGELKELLMSGLEEHEKVLQERLRQLEITVALKQDGVPSKAEQKAVKEEFTKELRKELVALGVDKKAAKKEMKKAYVDQLNNRPWKVFDNTFQSGGVSYQSKQVPASKMGVPAGLEGKISGLFTEPYQDGGVSSVDNTNTEHATNLWRSEFVVKGKTLFTGIRHGINTPYGLKDGKVKEAGADQKTKEDVLAALASKPDLLRQAIEAGEEGSGVAAPVLRTSSTSLVTTGLGSGAENKMQKAQNKAFKKLAEGPQPIELEVPTPDGGTRKVKLVLKQARFNIPVNWGGVNKASVMTDGRITQFRMNRQGMKDLVGGTKGPVGGIVGDHLKAEREKIDDLRVKYEELKQRDQMAYSIAVKSNPETDTKLSEDTVAAYRDLRNAMKDYSLTNDLVQQVRDIYRKGTHHREHHDAYKLAARVVLLTSRAEAVPMYNCKSGKDRTGMLDAEVKFLAARMERDGKVPVPGEQLSEGDQKLFQDILMETGNQEVQEYNVGVRGYKTNGVGSIKERAGDVWGAAHGVSEAAGS